MDPEARVIYEARLRDAAGQVQAALKLLNTAKHTCDGCGLERAANWSETKAAEELAAIERKLKRLLTRTK